MGTQRGERGKDRHAHLLKRWRSRHINGSGSSFGSADPGRN
ncbi:hypothetical protein XCR_2669 [Xanthomonas campestris pv. raphani 756C]|nr:hypothetical protein XCR_2669 [Xanthomonas campestris pv. raphani 756C]